MRTGLSLVATALLIASCDSHSKLDITKVNSDLETGCFMALYQSPSTTDQESISPNNLLKNANEIVLEYTDKDGQNFAEMRINDKIYKLKRDRKLHYRSTDGNTTLDTDLKFKKELQDDLGNTELISGTIKLKHGSRSKTIPVVGFNVC